jgi:Na+/melibiose symporter-like transporter
MTDQNQDLRDLIDPHTVPTKSRLAFGVGSTAETLSLYSVSALGMLFYNQVLGLDILLAGLVPTLAIFGDAISDPLIGSWSDRFRSKKWGRRHPFMLLAPIPVAVSFWMVFNPPETLAGGSLFWWFLAWSVVLRTCMTVYHVPHLAMGGELSKEYTERTKIMSYNNFFGWIGGAGFFKINSTVFFATTAQTANGFLRPDAYEPFSITIAIVIAIVLFVSAWFTLDRIPHLPQPAQLTSRFGFREFYGDLFKAFGNRNYLFLMIALFALSMMLGIRGGMGTYMNIYYWEFRSEDIGNLILMGSFFGYISGFLFSARIHNRFDKRATIVTTAVTLSVFPAMPVILRLMGFFPENGSWMLLPAVAAFGALAAASGSIINISVMSAIADIADENALKYGVRQEGILYSARTFFAKLDNSLGHGVAAVALKMIEFPDKAVPGEVDADIVWWLGIVDSPMAIVPGLIAACFYARYRIDKSGYEETRKRLAEAASTSDRLAVEDKIQRS